MARTSARRKGRKQPPPAPTENSSPTENIAQVVNTTPTPTPQNIAPVVNTAPTPTPQNNAPTENTAPTPQNNAPTPQNNAENTAPTPNRKRTKKSARLQQTTPEPTPREPTIREQVIAEITDGLDQNDSDEEFTETPDDFDANNPSEEIDDDEPPEMDNKLLIDRGLTPEEYALDTKTPISINPGVTRATDRLVPTKVARHYRQAFKTYLEKGCIHWAEVSMVTKNLYYEEMKKQFKWRKGSEEDQIKTIWNIEAARKYKDYIHCLKKHYLAGTLPTQGCGAEQMKSLGRRWENPREIAKALQNKKNRHSGAEEGSKALCTHTSGATPHFVVAANMTKKTGKRANMVEVHDASHKYRKGPSVGKFCTSTAKEISESAKKKAAELLAAAAPPTSSANGEPAGDSVGEASTPPESAFNEAANKAFVEVVTPLASHGWFTGASCLTKDTPMEGVESLLPTYTAQPQTPSASASAPPTQRPSEEMQQIAGLVSSMVAPAIGEMIDKNIQGKLAAIIRDAVSQAVSATIGAATPRESQGPAVHRVNGDDANPAE